MDEVLKQGKICEATMCYTGDILDPARDRYTLEYYVNMAKELEKRGAHILAIKDMSGLLKPLCRQEAGLHPEAGGGPAHPPAHPRHHRQPGGHPADGRRGRGGHRGHRHLLHVLPDQPALHECGGGRPGGHRSGTRGWT